MVQGIMYLCIVTQSSSATLQSINVISDAARVRVCSAILSHGHTHAHSTAYYVMCISYVYIMLC